MNHKKHTAGNERTREPKNLMHLSIVRCFHGGRECACNLLEGN